MAAGYLVLNSEIRANRYFDTTGVSFNFAREELINILGFKVRVNINIFRSKPDEGVYAVATAEVFSLQSCSWQPLADLIVDQKVTDSLLRALHSFFFKVGTPQAVIDADRFDNVVAPVMDELREQLLDKATAIFG